MRLAKTVAAGLAVALVMGCGLLPRGQQRATAPEPAFSVDPEATDDGTIEDAVPPSVDLDAVFRPTFTTTEGEIDAGSGFLIRWPDGPVLLLTAHHLLGTTGGMSREYTGAELAGVVTGVTAASVDDENIEVASSTMVDLPEAVSSDVDIRRDIAAFQVAGTSGATVLELAAAPPKPGDRVYLLAETDKPGSRIYPAVETAKRGTPYLQFEYDDEVTLKATSGAPILNSDGKVVGINIGGDESKSPAEGHANSIETFVPLLRKHLS
ncbi:serine protease [Actinoplanes sp. NPDC049265]|uniref:S1 family peptidase n=1 Tax=Actinoplanes sp. NPDC049265 TaxID=3363902 RepID=UPI003711D578